MTDDQIDAFLTWISAVDNRRLTNETLDAWAQILPRHISLEDAKAAAAAHFRDRPGEYLMPAHVIGGVRDIRGSRIRAIRAIAPLGDPDDVAAYQMQRRRLIEAVASGLVDPGDGEAVEFLRADVARQVGQVGAGRPRQIGA